MFTVDRPHALKLPLKKVHYVKKNSLFPTFCIQNIQNKFKVDPLLGAAKFQDGSTTDSRQVRNIFLRVLFAGGFEGAGCDCLGAPQNVPY